MNDEAWQSILTIQKLRGPPMDFAFPAVKNGRQSALQPHWGYFRRGVGRVIRYFTEADAGIERLQKSYLIWLARSHPADRMSESEINDYLRDRYYTTCSREDVPEVVRSLQGQVIPLISEILRRDKAVRSVLDIGVALAKADCYLATAFPDVSFIGVDFWADLDEINRELQCPNLRLIRGYALDLIESGTLNADLVFTTSTATRMKNAELRRYLRALAKSTRYIVLNEPLFRKPDGTIPQPSRLPIDISEPILIHPVYAGDRSGGLPPCLCHNYAAMCEEAGFEVIYQRTIHGDTPRIWLVARRASKDR